MYETDIIGGFPITDPYCKGCGKVLTLENAWMTDGCPCNHVLGVNSMNETRWRLLMMLQQSQQHKLAQLESEDYIPDGYHVVEDLDGIRLVKNANS